MLGVFLGFTSSLAINYYLFNQDQVTLTMVGIFSFGVVLTAFLANLTDLMKNHIRHEETMKSILREISYIGMYQYLVSASIHVTND